MGGEEWREGARARGVREGVREEGRESSPKCTRPLSQVMEALRSAHLAEAEGREQLVREANQARDQAEAAATEAEANLHLVASRNEASVKRTREEMAKEASKVFKSAHPSTFSPRLSHLPPLLSFPSPPSPFRPLHTPYLPYPP